MAPRSGDLHTAQDISSIFDEYWLNFSVNAGDIIEERILEHGVGLSNNILQKGKPMQTADLRRALEQTVSGYATSRPGGDGSDGNLTVDRTQYFDADRLYQFNNLYITDSGRIRVRGSGHSLRILVKGTLRMDSGSRIYFDGESGRRGYWGRRGSYGRYGDIGTGRASGGSGGRGGSGRSSYSRTNGGRGGAGGDGGTGGRGGNGETSSGKGPYSGKSGDSGSAGSNGSSGASNSSIAYTYAISYDDVISQNHVHGRRYGGGDGGHGGSGYSGHRGSKGSKRRRYCDKRNSYGNCKDWDYRSGYRGRGGRGGRGGHSGGEGGGGGYGAGVIYIEAKHLDLHGRIYARGGRGGYPGGWWSYRGQYGQGGAGGLIVLRYHTQNTSGFYTYTDGGYSYDNAPGPDGRTLWSQRS